MPTYQISDVILVVMDSYVQIDPISRIINDAIL